MKRISRFTRLCALVLGALLLGGCVVREVDGDAMQFTYEWWVLPLIAAIVVGAVVWGVRTLRADPPVASRNARWTAWVVVVGGPVVLLFAPTYHLHPLRVDPAGFERHAGLVFAPSSTRVEFAELERIEIEVTERLRSRSDNLTLVTIGRDGTREEHSVGDQLREALPDVLGFAADAGVEIVDPR